MANLQEQIAKIQKTIKHFTGLIAITEHVEIRPDVRAAIQKLQDEATNSDVKEVYRKIVSDNMADRTEAKLNLTRYVDAQQRKLAELEAQLASVPPQVVALQKQAEAVVTPPVTTIVENTAPPVQTTGPTLQTAGPVSTQVQGAALNENDLHVLMAKIRNGTATVEDLTKAGIKVPPEVQLAADNAALALRAQTHNTPIYEPTLFEDAIDLRALDTDPPFMHSIIRTDRPVVDFDYDAYEFIELVGVAMGYASQGSISKQGFLIGCNEVVTLEPNVGITFNVPLKLIGSVMKLDEHVSDERSLSNFLALYHLLRNRMHFILPTQFLFNGKRVFAHRANDILVSQESAEGEANSPIRSDALQSIIHATHGLSVIGVMLRGKRKPVQTANNPGLDDSGIFDDVFGFSENR